MRRRPPAYASAFAYTTPTSSAPTSPGPCVTATASTALHETPASASARSTTAGRAARWARLASSGTTPPNTLWMSWDRMIRLASSGGGDALRAPPTRTAADVSSHDVSMPRRTSATAGALAQGDRVGDRGGDEAGERASAALDQDARERALVDDAQVPGDSHFLWGDAHDAERRRVDR